MCECYDTIKELQTQLKHQRDLNSKLEFQKQGLVAKVKRENDLNNNISFCGHSQKEIDRLTKENKKLNDDCIAWAKNNKILKEELQNVANVATQSINDLKRQNNPNDNIPFCRHSQKEIDRLTKENKKLNDDCITWAKNSKIVKEELLATKEKLHQECEYVTRLETENAIQKTANLIYTNPDEKVKIIQSLKIRCLQAA